MRIIPGKTKVKIELFKGISIWDMVVGLIVAIIVVLTVASSLPFKFIFAILELLIGAVLLARLDKEPNYIYLMNMLKHFAYPRNYKKMYSDKELVQIAEESFNEVAFKEIFESGDSEEKKTEEPEEEKAEIEAKVEATEEGSEEVEAESSEEKTEEAETEASEEKTEEAEAEEAEESEESEDVEEEPKERAETKAERKQRLKAEKAEYKADSKLLKSKTLTKEEEDAIWLKRANQSKAKKDAKKAAKNQKKSNKQTKLYEMDDIIAFTDIKDGFISYAGRYYGAAIEIPSVPFKFFSSYRRNNTIEACLGSVLRAVNVDFATNIVKIERPISFEQYIDNEYEKLDSLRASYEQGMISEKELKVRVDVVYERINELLDFERKEKVVVPFYYLVLYDTDKGQLANQIRNAVDELKRGEMKPHVLNDKELALFLKYSNELDFDEKEIDKINPEDYAKWAMPSAVNVKHRYVMIDQMICHNMRVVNYPIGVNDGWLASVMTIPSTKVVVKATPMDRSKAISAIDKSLTELRTTYMSAKTDSQAIEISQHIDTLQTLLVMLQGDNESLLNVNIYVSAYDPQLTIDDPKVEKFKYETNRTRIANMKKTIRRHYQEEGLRLNNMEFNQTRAFIASQISGYDPLASDGRGMPSNTVAATYPWVFASAMDDKGFKLGDAEGVPVFIDFFKRNSERVNSNMVIVGKSGSGKSYATKSLLSNLAADDAKIFILDPENEYTQLAKNMHGKFINVANAQFGRLNPFHIITALEDDEEGGDIGSSYSMHLQFLEEFFRQILPDCDNDSLEYLNSLVDRTYQNKDINETTDLALLSPEDYPTFDDLYDEILKEFQRTDNEYIRTILRTLMNYISKFASGGRNAGIWNGPSTITTDENFTVFNFQSLLSNRNTTIANAQMLLVLKYIDNEIIKNRDYNLKYNLNRKVIVVIDEAHVFIDTKYPVALDFMLQLAKRIRKYNGMQIVITQNIKDFVGSEEIARKSTAIINACQYSLIFSLAPNDMQDLCKLYEKAGGINEQEQEEIVQAPRGQAFAIMSPTTRTTFHVHVTDDIAKIYKPEYRSPYFGGPHGAENWADYIKDSPAKREANMAELVARRKVEEESREKEEVVKEIEFSEVTDAELNSLGFDINAAETKRQSFTASEMQAANEAESSGSSEISFSEVTEDELLDFDLADSMSSSVDTGEIKFEEIDDLGLEGFENVQLDDTPKVQPVQASMAQIPVGQVAPQIIVQAPPQSQRTEELLAELLSKFSTESISEQIRQTVKAEVSTEMSARNVVSSADLQAEAIRQLEQESPFVPASVASAAPAPTSELASTSDSFDLFGDLFADEEPIDDEDTGATSQPLGNIFDFAAQDLGDSLGSDSEGSQGGGDDFGFNIMDLLQEEAQKLDEISPIDEMITYGEDVCDITLAELIAYITKQ